MSEKYSRQLHVFLLLLFIAVSRNSISAYGLEVSSLQMASRTITSKVLELALSAESVTPSFIRMDYAAVEDLKIILEFVLSDSGSGTGNELEFTLACLDLSAALAEMTARHMLLDTLSSSLTGFVGEFIEPDFFIAPIERFLSERIGETLAGSVKNYLVLSLSGTTKEKFENILRLTGQKLKNLTQARRYILVIRRASRHFNSSLSSEIMNRYLNVIPEVGSDIKRIFTNRSSFQEKLHAAVEFLIHLNSRSMSLLDFSKKLYGYSSLILDMEKYSPEKLGTILALPRSINEAEILAKFLSRETESIELVYSLGRQFFDLVCSLDSNSTEFMATHPHTSVLLYRLAGKRAIEFSSRHGEFGIYVLGLPSRKHGRETTASIMDILYFFFFRVRRLDDFLFLLWRYLGLMAVTFFIFTVYLEAVFLFWKKKKRIVSLVLTGLLIFPFIHSCLSDEYTFLSPQEFSLPLSTTPSTWYDSTAKTARKELSRIFFLEKNSIVASVPEIDSLKRRIEQLAGPVFLKAGIFSISMSDSLTADFERRTDTSQKKTFPSRGIFLSIPLSIKHDMNSEKCFSMDCSLVDETGQSYRPLIAPSNLKVLPGKTLEVTLTFDIDPVMKPKSLVFTEGLLFRNRYELPLPVSSRTIINDPLRIAGLPCGVKLSKFSETGETLEIHFIHPGLSPLMKEKKDSFMKFLANAKLITGNIILVPAALEIRQENSLISTLVLSYPFGKDDLTVVSSRPEIDIDSHLIQLVNYTDSRKTEELLEKFIRLETALKEKEAGDRYMNPPFIMRWKKDENLAQRHYEAARKYWPELDF